MDYYTALQKTYREEEKSSFLPTTLTREQMLTAIDDITQRLKGSLPNSERIILASQRYGLRTRLDRAEAVANRLLGNKSHTN